MWLTPEQKCDIATWELEEVRGVLEKLRMESERVLDSYKVNLTELPEHRPMNNNKRITRYNITMLFRHPIYNL